MYSSLALAALGRSGAYGARNELWVGEVCDPMTIFTRHAKNRMRRDKIDQTDADDCVRNPDFERRQDVDKREVWKVYREGYLKVVYREEGEDGIVITVTPKKKRPAWAAN